MPGAQIGLLRDVACPACACFCDDIEVAVQHNQLRRTRNACILGKRWFQNSRPTGEHPAFVGNEPASVEAAIEAAARVLSAARYPLVCGLTRASCEAQRIAVAIADRLGGCIDPCAPHSERVFLRAIQHTGQVTCTLGEVRHRCDLLIFWGCDPLETHPRHWGRYSVLPRGQFIPEGRMGRTIVVVHSKPNRTARAADLAIRIEPGADLEALSALRGFINGIELAHGPGSALRDSLHVFRDLADRMKHCRFGVLFPAVHLADAPAGCLAIEATIRLTQDLNRFTRFRTLCLGEPGNSLGAAQVLTWQTGYPFAVSFHRGVPMFEPDTHSSDRLLSRSEVDAALIVAGSMADFSADAQRGLEAIPYIAVGCVDDATRTGAAVAIRTSIVGVDADGTMYRADGVPLYVRAVSRSSFPHDFAILSRLDQRLGEFATRRKAPG